MVTTGLHRQALMQMHAGPSRRKVSILQGMACAHVIPLCDCVAREAMRCGQFTGSFWHDTYHR